MKTAEIKWHKENGDWVSDCKTYRIEPLYWGNVSPSSYKLFVNEKHYHTAGKLRIVKESANDLLKKEIKD